MSKEVYHSIFYKSDGGTLAREIKDFFARKRYSIQFNLHKLQDTDDIKASLSGVSVLLITPDSFDFIQSRKDLDLNKLFPTPDYSVALLFHIHKSRDEISRILASRVKNSHQWSVLEFHSGSGLSALGIHIMQIVERIECDIVPSSSVRQFQVWRPEDIKPHQHVILIFKEPVGEETKISVLQEWDGAIKEAHHLNYMTYSFILGDATPGDKNIEVFANNVSYGNAVLHVNEVRPNMKQITTLLQSVINPLELICQCLYIVPENRHDLDEELVGLLSDDKNIVCNIFDQRFGDSHLMSGLPTLLHFGAKYGLTQFCMQLIKLPDSLNCLKVKNNDGMLPRDFARNGGFYDLAAFLQKTENDLDDAFPSSTNHDEKRETESFKGLMSSRGHLLHLERHGSTLTGNPTKDILQREESINDTISTDYTANARRMTNMTGNVGSRLNASRNQPWPALGKIKRKDHHYDLPSDTP